MDPAPRHRLKITLLFLAAILPFELNGWYNPRLAPHPRAFWTVEVLTWIVLPAAVVIAGLRGGLFTLPDLGLSARVRGRRNPAVLALLLAAVPFVLYPLDRWAVEVAPRLLGNNRGAVPFEYTDMIPPPGPNTGWFRLLALTHLALTAGFVEEILYRGMLARVFTTRPAGTVGYVLASSLVFASAHWEGGTHQLWESFVFGLATAAVFRVTGNLWPLVLAHVIIDWSWFS